MPKRFKKVYVEISNVCNLQCSFCPEVERDKAFMTPDLFQRVIAEIAPLTESVCFHLMGEPLLHPQFNEFVAHSGAAGLPINLTSNGILVRPENHASLLHPGIAQINFSLQSFAANFPGGDDSSYLERIFALTREAVRIRPDLYVNFRLWNEGSADAGGNPRILEAIRQGLGVNFNAFADVRWKKSVKVEGRVYVHFDSRFEWPHPQLPRRSQTGFCHALSSHIGILTDGTVVPCCLDKEGRLALGHLNQQSLHAVLASARAKGMRRGFQEGVLTEDLCQKCTFIARFDRKAASFSKSVASTFVA